MLNLEGLWCSNPLTYAVSWGIDGKDSIHLKWHPFYWDCVAMGRPQWPLDKVAMVVHLCPVSLPINWSFFLRGGDREPIHNRITSCHHIVFGLLMINTISEEQAAAEGEKNTKKEEEKANLMMVSQCQTENQLLLGAVQRDFHIIFNS